MGAPKQKWTRIEEAALKAGVLKHGSGKWRAILLDPQFGSYLTTRSNVDLKDKWRNISVTTVYGSRNNAKLASRRTPYPNDHNSKALAILAMANGNGGGRQFHSGSPSAAPFGPPQHDFKALFTSVDKVILEAMTNLARPLGVDLKSILQYTENSNMEPNMKRLVNTRVRHLLNVGTLVRAKLKFKISPNYAAAKANQSSPQLVLKGNKENAPNPQENAPKPQENAPKPQENAPKPQENGVQVNGGLLMIQGMTAQEAAVAAARAVAEAEVAIAEAKQAAREAEEAEAQAEAAKIFAVSAMQSLKLTMRNVIVKP